MNKTIVGTSPRNPMWVYEENYRLLLRLLPELPEQGGRLMLVSRRVTGDLAVRVLEVNRYTTTIELAKPFAVDREYLPDLSMKVRIYYDAGVTEVLGYQGCDRIPARYQVAGTGRYVRDEKRQVNHLLNDLLRHCRRYDYHYASSDFSRA